MAVSPRPDAAEAPLDWTALRDFLAVAETGSLSRAARRLGTSQPTLTRRMAALEERLRTELFRRTPRGVELTEAGESIVPAARQMEQEAHAVEIAISGRDAALAGVVRVTATEGLGIHWLTPALAEFQLAHPAIEIQLLIQNQVLNLLQREADIAVRLSRPLQSDLVGRKVGDLAFGLYASRDYLARRGRPATPEDLAQHRCVAFDETARWLTGPGASLERALSAASVAFRANSGQAQLAAIRAGCGIGVAARFLAERCGEIEQVLPETEIALELWLITHPAMRRSARIRAVYDFLAKRFEDARELFKPS
ncbi:MAG TPA: LysR family transcriptional regulator [Myxococcota bacterium]|jgi:DNA-binding transcriptional LysR family regulator